jgi:hypothetical protein
MISPTALVNVLRLNPWYRSSPKTLTGDWVLRLGWWHWVVRP